MTGAQRIGDPREFGRVAVLMGGTWLHPLGTDELGRDVLARLIYSIRTSLLVSIETIAHTMVTPADGPSLGIAPAGT